MTNSGNIDNGDKKHDLTQKLFPFMDTHFMIQLLDFLLANNLYNNNEVLTSKLALVQQTKRVELASDVYKLIHGADAATTKKEFDSEKSCVEEKLSSCKSNCATILDLLNRGNEMKQLKDDNLLSAAYLAEKYEITANMLDAFFEYAKLKYECGMYEDSFSYLSLYAVVVSSQTEKYMAALWGKLASGILTLQWNEAMNDVSVLAGLIEKSGASPLEQLEQRTWLLHWVLFIFSNSSDHQQEIVEMMFQSKFLEAMQTNSPFLLRYLAVGVLLHDDRKRLIKDVVQVLTMEVENVKDPILQFVKSLYVDFEFDNAQERLAQCQIVLASDVFLFPLRDQFMKNARIGMLESFCRIHEKVDVNLLIQKLALSSNNNTQSEIVELIEESQIDAKVDSERNCVVMNNSEYSVYHQIIQNTRDLALRTSNLVAQMERSGSKGRRHR